MCFALIIQGTSWRILSWEYEVLLATHVARGPPKPLSALHATAGELSHDVPSEGSAP